MATRIYITRLLLIFIVGFIVVLAALNFGVIKTNANFGLSQFADLFGDKNKTAVSLQSVVEPHQFPNISPELISEPLPDKAHLVISKIGIDVPIVMNVPNNNDAIFDSLVDGIVQHPIGPKPGDNGMSILLGHSSNNPLHNSKYGTVFALIGKLEYGDKFYIEYSNGRRFDYEVRESFIYNPFDLNDTNLHRIEELDYDGIVLTTCWPVGTNQKRQAVLAQEL